MIYTVNQRLRLWGQGGPAPTISDIGGHCPHTVESTAVAVVFKATDSFPVCYLHTMIISTNLEAKSS